jgi:hypothetical protein
MRLDPPDPRHHRIDGVSGCLFEPRSLEHPGVADRIFEHDLITGVMQRLTFPPRRR